MIFFISICRDLVYKIEYWSAYYDYDRLKNVSLIGLKDPSMGSFGFNILFRSILAMRATKASTTVIFSACSCPKDHSNHTPAVGPKNPRVEHFARTAVLFLLPIFFMLT